MFNPLSPLLAPLTARYYSKRYIINNYTCDFMSYRHFTLSIWPSRPKDFSPLMYECDLKCEV